MFCYKSINSIIYININYFYMLYESFNRSKNPRCF